MGFTMFLAFWRNISTNFDRWILRFPSVKLRIICCLIGLNRALFLLFGYSAGEWTRLRDDILRMTENFPLTFERDNAFGGKYAVRGTIKAPNGRMIGLTTIWMMEPGEPAKVKFIMA